MHRMYLNLQSCGSEVRRHLILHTCIATVSSELWHLSPLVCVWVVSLPTTQFVRMAIGPAHHVKLTLIG